MATIALQRATATPRRHSGRPKLDVRAFLARAWRNFTTRRQLAELDDRMLQDLGISRAQAHFEANRPIWR